MSHTEFHIYIQKNCLLRKIKLGSVCTWAVEEKGGVLVSQVIVVHTAPAMTSPAILYQYWPNEYKDKIARQKSKKSHFCQFMFFFLSKSTQEEVVVQTAPAMTSRAVLYQYWPNEYKDKIARQKSQKSHFCKFIFLPKYTQEVFVVQTAPAMTSLAILYQYCQW